MRRTLLLLASGFIVSSQLGCGVLTDAFSCKDEEERFN